MTADSDTVAAWLRYVYAKAITADLGGVIVLSAPVTDDDGKSGWKSRCYQLDEIDDAANAAVTASDGGLNMYYRVHLLSAPVATWRRGGGDLTRWVTHIAADVDTAGLGHKPPDGTTLPTIDQAIDMIDATLAPSAIIASGGGLYPVWRLAEPFEITGPDQRERFKNLGRRLDAALGSHGYHVDSTALDLSRVIRPPGVDNRKAGRDVRPVTIHRHWNDGAGDYRLDELERHLPALAPRPIKKIRAADTVGDAPWDIFAAKFSITDVLNADPTHTWEDVGTRGGMPAWRYVGSSSDYSLKQADTGAVIVWSGTVAAQLNIEPGQAVDLWGLACKLAGVDPSKAAKFRGTA
jgi:hypothetical protein